jgi:hypothetical protein
MALEGLRSSNWFNSLLEVSVWSEKVEFGPENDVPLADHDGLDPEWTVVFRGSTHPFRQPSKLQQSWFPGHSAWKMHWLPGLGWEHLAERVIQTPGFWKNGDIVCPLQTAQAAKNAKRRNMFSVRVSRKLRWIRWRNSLGLKMSFFSINCLLSYVIFLWMLRTTVEKRSNCCLIVRNSTSLDCILLWQRNNAGAPQFYCRSCNFTRTWYTDAEPKPFSAQSITPTECVKVEVKERGNDRTDWKQRILNVSEAWEKDSSEEKESDNEALHGLLNTDTQTLSVSLKLQKVVHFLA